MSGKTKKDKSKATKHHLLKMTQAERKEMRDSDPVYYAQMLGGAVKDAFAGENNDEVRKKRINKGYGIKGYKSGGSVRAQGSGCAVQGTRKAKIR